MNNVKLLFVSCIQCCNCSFLPSSIFQELQCVLEYKAVWEHWKCLRVEQQVVLLKDLKRQYIRQKAVAIPVEHTVRALKQKIIIRGLCCPANEPECCSLWIAKIPARALSCWSCLCPFHFWYTYKGAFDPKGFACCTHTSSDFHTKIRTVLQNIWSANSHFSINNKQEEHLW